MGNRCLEGFLMLVVILSLVSCPSPSGGSPSGPQTPSATIYLVGGGLGPYAFVAGYWKGGVWNGLSSLNVNYNSSATSIAVSSSNVYIGGTSCSDGTHIVPGYWENSGWNGLSITGTSGSANALAFGGTDFYAAGFDSMQACYWKNGGLIDLGIVSGYYASGGTSIAISGNDVYVGGFLVTNTTYIDVPGFWKNGTWNPMATLDATKSDKVNAVAISGSDVYTGGVDIDSSGVAESGYWKNGTWNTLAAIDSTKDCQVVSIVVSGSDIYIGGWSTKTDGTRVPGVWKNGTWSAFTIPGPQSMISSLVLVGSDVYASGYYTA